jgi:hypothetical protein
MSDGQMSGLYGGWRVFLSLKSGIMLETTFAVWTVALAMCTRVHGLCLPETFVWGFIRNRYQYFIPEVDCVDSHILRQPVHVYKTFDSQEGDQHTFVGANCAPRASRQLPVQRQPNGTWRCVDEYPRLIASDNIPKLSLLLLAEDIKESSGTLYPLIPQFAGQHMGEPSEVSRLHVQGYGTVSMNCRERQARA